MNRQAIVGIFTVVALIGLFGFFLVLANVGPEGRYKTAVHFKSASGLHKGALVYESGVVVGVIDQTNLLEDFTVEVVMAINNNVDVPRNARFIIQAPLTGDADLEIVPVVPPPQSPGMTEPTNAPRTVAVLPREVVPIDQQPQGTNPATIQDLVDQGQGETRRLDRMLAQLEQKEPALLNTLQSALDNANHVSVTADRSFTNLSRRLDSLTSTLQVALVAGSANLNDVTGELDATVRRNAGHFDAIVAALDASSRDLNRTADQITALASDPQLHANILQTTQGIAQTATTFASIANDLRNVSGNPQTQAQLRDTIANVDAASQKANSLLAQFGGRSSVYGVDRGATPEPASGTSRPGAPGAGGPGAAGATPAPGSPQSNVKNKVGSLVRSLIALQVRVTELDQQHANTSASALLTRDRGPSTDVNIIAVPNGSTYLYTGFNDVGGPASTVNFAAMQRVVPHLSIGGGIVYSRLGARAVYSPALSRGLGFDALIYDPRHPTADAYANYGLGNGLTLFGGERDALHAGRRTAFGLQYQF